MNKVKEIRSGRILRRLALMLAVCLASVLFHIKLHYLRASITALVIGLVGCVDPDKQVEQQPTVVDAVMAKAASSEPVALADKEVVTLGYTVDSVDPTWSWKRKDNALEARTALSESCAQCNEQLTITSGCAALVRNGARQYTGSGHSLGKAIVAARDTCRSDRCEVKVAVCLSDAGVSDWTLFEVARQQDRAIDYVLNGLHWKQRRKLLKCARRIAKNLERPYSSSSFLPSPSYSPADSYGVFLGSIILFYQGDFKTRRWANTSFGQFSRLPLYGDLLLFNIPREMFSCTVRAG